jgi:alpha-glucosidase
MRKSAFLFSVFLLHMTAFAQEKWTVNSPHQSLQIQLRLENHRLLYQVTDHRTTVIEPSELGIERADADFTQGLSFASVREGVVDESYEMKIGKRKMNHAVARESTVSFKNQKGEVVEIQLRAYDEGVAFRYRFPGAGHSITVVNEASQFHVPTTGQVWFENYDLPTEYTPAYEGVYENGIPIGTNAKDSGGWAFPALFHTMDHWLLITESNLDRNYFGSHLQPNCEGGVYKIARPLAGEAKGTGTITATGSEPFATPWRAIVIGQKLGTIVESNLVYHLADANRLGDVSWVRPGRASWSWWSDHASSKDFNKLKSFVDLAKDMGWEYSLVDANWNIMQGGTIQELVKYAQSKHIGLLLWYNSGGAHNVVTEQPRDIMSDPVRRKEEFKKLRAWGVKGVKVDFFQSDKQHIVQLYHNILEDAAREHIMVNFHGCTLPRGWSRTYPNLMSMEAVRGAENYGWGKEFANKAPEHNNILTYTRNVVGPMDYTPVTFSSYDCCPHVTSNAQELALSVLFETGILHFADKVSEYEALDPRIKRFLRRVPTTWDDTRFVEGYPGKETVLARRSGNVWYVAGANGEAQAKNLQVALPFLSAGEYEVQLMTDGNDPHSIAVAEKNISGRAALPVTMQAYGGFVLVLTPRHK